MKMSAYAKMSGWECLLLAVTSVSLGYLVLRGFDAGDVAVTTPLPAVIALVVTLALFFVGSSKRRMLIGGCVLGACLLVSLVAAAALTAVSVTSDEVGNWLIVVLMVELCTVVAYLLSRKRAGTAVLLAVTIFTCGWIQFFYATNDYLWSFAAVISALTLVAYKNYQMSARAVASARKVSFSAGFALSAALVVVAVGVGCLAWFAVIAPLNPPVLQVKLITEYRALETVQAKGTSEAYLTPNMDLSSEETNALKRTTDDLREEAGGVDEPARPREQEAVEDPTSGTFTGVDLSSLQETFELTTGVQLSHVLLPAALILVLLVIGYFVGRRWWRARRLARFQKLDASGQVSALYLFLMERFRRLGHALPDGMTPSEYAVHNAATFEPYDQAGGASFGEVTRAYTAVAYGEQEASEEDAQMLARYYQGLWKAARTQLGNVKYFLKSFRL